MISIEIIYNLDYACPGPDERSYGAEAQGFSALCEVRNLNSIRAFDGDGRSVLAILSAGAVAFPPKRGSGPAFSPPTGAR